LSQFKEENIASFLPKFGLKYWSPTCRDQIEIMPTWHYHKTLLLSRHNDCATWHNYEVT